MLTTPTHAADTVLLHAAGSLRGALTEVSNAFEKASGAEVVAKYGPSGLLRDEIAGGAKAEVFASAKSSAPRRRRPIRQAIMRLRYSRKPMA